MKKISVLVSCFAVMLVFSQMSFANEVVAVQVAPCPTVAAQSVTLPFDYTGLNVSLSSRDVRRAAQLNSRIAIRQTRLDARLYPPPLPAYPFAVAAADGEAAPVVASGGPILQSGKRNYSVQKGSYAPVVNFLSITRGR